MNTPQKVDDLSYMYVAVEANSYLFIVFVLHIIFVASTSLVVHKQIEE